ncbi:unnamed protein product, partial [Prorocentrum cordatum]
MSRTYGPEYLVKDPIATSHQNNGAGFTAADTPWMATFYQCTLPSTNRPMRRHSPHKRPEAAAEPSGAKAGEAPVKSGWAAFRERQRQATAAGGGEAPPERRWTGAREHRAAEERAAAASRRPAAAEERAAASSRPPAAAFPAGELEEGDEPVPISQAEAMEQAREAAREAREAREARAQ